MMRASSGAIEKFYDVVIIGAGISGALAAEAVSRVTPNILVVDRRAPAGGSTSASTALVQWEIDVPLRELVRKVGGKRARASYAASHQAVQRLIRRIRNNGIACEMAKRPTLLLAGNAMGPKALKEETRLRRQLKLPSRYLDADALRDGYGFEREGAILSTGNCEVDPRKLTKGLLKIAMARGATCVFPLDVTSLAATDKGVFVEFSDGRIIAANKVIAATGYEALPQIPGSKYDLISTWALATARMPAGSLWKDRALVWEASDPYLYMRCTADGRIIAGGEDEAFADAARRDAKLDIKTRRVLAKLKKLLPDTPLTAEFAWAGTFAESPTGLPVIGELAELPNVFAILGSGGNGITFSTIAADMAQAWVRGKSHRHAPLFAAHA